MTSYEKLTRFTEGDAGAYREMDTDEHAMVYFMYLAAKAGKRFRETGDARLITSLIHTWLQIVGLSRQQANAVLKTVTLEMALKSSVV